MADRALRDGAGQLLGLLLGDEAALVSATGHWLQALVALLLHRRPEQVSVRRLLHGRRLMQALWARLLQCSLPTLCAGLAAAADGSAAKCALQIKPHVEHQFAAVCHRLAVAVHTSLQQVAVAANLALKLKALCTATLHACTLSCTSLQGDHCPGVRVSCISWPADPACVQASLQQLPSAAKRALHLKPHAEEVDAEEQAQAALSVVLEEALPVSLIVQGMLLWVCVDHC